MYRCLIDCDLSIVYTQTSATIQLLNGKSRLNFESQLLNRHRQEVLKEILKNDNYNIYRFITAVQTQFPDEYHVIWSKAPKELLMDLVVILFLQLLFPKLRINYES